MWAFSKKNLTHLFFVHQKKHHHQKMLLLIFYCNLSRKYERGKERGNQGYIVLFNSCLSLLKALQQLWGILFGETQPMVGSCVSHENTMLDSTDCYPLFLWNTIRIRQESHEKIHGLFVKISKERRWPGFELGPLDSSSLNRALYHWATKALDMKA